MLTGWGILCVDGVYSWRDSATRFLTSGFFSWISFPKPLSIPLRPFWIFSKIRGDIGSSSCTTGVVDTGGKWKESLIIKIRNYRNVIIRGLWEGDSWKKPWRKKSHDTVPLRVSFRNQLSYEIGSTTKDDLYCTLYRCLCIFLPNEAMNQFCRLMRLCSVAMAMITSMFPTQITRFWSYLSEYFLNFLSQPMAHYEGNDHHGYDHPTCHCD